MDSYARSGHGGPQHKATPHMPELPTASNRLIKELLQCTVKACGTLSAFSATPSHPVPCVCVTPLLAVLLVTALQVKDTQLQVLLVVGMLQALIPTAATAGSIRVSHTCPGCLPSRRTGASSQATAWGRHGTQHCVLQERHSISSISMTLARSKVSTCKSPPKCFIGWLY